jgi:hypothetical protein
VSDQSIEGFGTLHRVPVRRILAISAASVIAAIAVVALGRWAPPFREISDGAILEIYTLEALKGRLLVGPYSRFGWHHPGPLFFYAEAPWYWLSGRHTVGMQAGAVLINLAAVGVALWTIARAASPWLAAAVSTATVWYVWRTGDMIASVWNPHMIILPLVAFIVVSAAFGATRHRAYLYLIVSIGSFLVQTHLATAPIVGLLAATSMIAQRSTLRGLWLPASGLALVLWIPPIIEQVTRAPGNMTRIAAFFSRGNSVGQHIGIAASAWAGALTGALRPGFEVAMGSNLERSTSAWSVGLSVVLLIAVGTAARLARMRGDRFAGWLASVSFVASAVALAATTQIRDRIVDHEVFWISALGVLNVGVAAGVFAAAGSARRGAASGGPSSVNRPPERGAYTDAKTVRAVARVVCYSAFAITFAIGLLALSHAMNRRRTLEDHAVDAMTEQIRHRLSTARASRPLFRIDPPLWPIAAGALLQLGKDGVAFAVDDRWTVMLGEAFEANGREDIQLALTGSLRLPVVAESR